MTDKKGEHKTAKEPPPVETEPERLERLRREDQAGEGRSEPAE